MGDLTFAQVREVNRIRCERWHPGFPNDGRWNGGDWGNALAGETGETCNIVKKLRRAEMAKSRCDKLIAATVCAIHGECWCGDNSSHDPWLNVDPLCPLHGTDGCQVGDPPAAELLAMLADEIADVFLYLDLLAQFYGLRIEDCIPPKFNRKSVEQGWPDLLIRSRGEAMSGKPSSE